MTPRSNWRLVSPKHRCATEGCEDAGIWLRNGERYCDLHRELIDEMESRQGGSVSLA